MASANPAQSFELGDVSYAPPRNQSESLHGNEPVYESGLEEEGEQVDPLRRDSNITSDSFMLYTPDEERVVLKKLDKRLVLFLALLYMLSFLDRSSWFPDPLTLRQ